MAYREGPLVRDLSLFLFAVLGGTIAGVVSQRLVLQFVGQPAGLNVSLAIATTCTGAVHSRLVHRKPFRQILPNIVAGAPVAYVAMRAIHFLAGF